MSLFSTHEDHVTRYRDENAVTLLQYANKKRVAGLFNDVFIQAGTESIPANKMVLSCYSKFFEAMFLVEFKEKYQDCVEIKQCDGKSVKTIIQYIYTGCVNIYEDNVMELLATADFLQMHDIKGFCFDYLESAINVTNCIDIFRASSLYRNQSSLQKAYQLINDNFDVIKNLENFKELSKTEFLSLLSKLNPEKVQESSIYTAVINWIRQDENRKQYFTTLFLSLELQKIS